MVFITNLIVNDGLAIFNKNNGKFRFSADEVLFVQLLILRYTYSHMDK
jgi:hypothetical protein